MQTTEKYRVATYYRMIYHLSPQHLANSSNKHYLAHAS